MAENAVKMGNGQPQSLTVSVKVNLEKETVWKYFTNPEDILCWNHASEDWHTTRAENELRPGGSFLSRMEAMDGSFGFDFSGIYDQVIPESLIAYTLADGRKVGISFQDEGAGSILVSETFETETVNPAELQQAGWQAILNNFKKYAEGRPR